MRAHAASFRVARARQRHRTAVVQLMGMQAEITIEGKVAHRIGANAAARARDDEHK